MIAGPLGMQSNIAEEVNADFCFMILKNKSSQTIVVVEIA